MLVHTKKPHTCLRAYRALRKVKSGNIQSTHFTLETASGKHGFKMCHKAKEKWRVLFSPNTRFLTFRYWKRKLRFSERVFLSNQRNRNTKSIPSILACCFVLPKLPTSSSPLEKLTAFCPKNAHKTFSFFANALAGRREMELSVSLVYLQTTPSKFSKHKARRRCTNTSGLVGEPATSVWIETCVQSCQTQGRLFFGRSFWWPGARSFRISGLDFLLLLAPFTPSSANPCTTERARL